MNSITVTCSEGHRVKVELALVVRCPTCTARPGDACLDMRFILDSENPRPRPRLAKLHPARQALIRNPQNGGEVSELPKWRPGDRWQPGDGAFLATCEFGHQFRVTRALAAQCPTCEARPGHPCMDAFARVDPVNPQPRPHLANGRLHSARVDQIRALDGVRH